MITSLTNPKIKNVVALRDRKRREETGLTIVEGRREVACALRAGVPFKELYICRELLDGSSMDDIPATSSSNVAVHETTKAVFSKMAYGDRAEGVLAVCAPAPLQLNNLKPKTAGLFVVAESLEKPGNLGAILRICDGAGVDGLIVCDGRTDLTNPNVIRASLGTVFSVPSVVCSNEEALEFLKSQKAAICAASLQAETIYTDEDLTGPVAVVVGSENSGLTDFWKTHADRRIKIPMAGSADSLNVSASTAVLLYEIVRQRNQ